VKYPKIDFQDIIYYSAPKPKKLKSMDEVDPELLRTFEKLGVPMNERAALAGVAVDVIFDSVSVRPPTSRSSPRSASSSARSRRRCAIIRSWCASTSAGGAAGRQLLRGAQFGGVHRRLVLLHPEGREVPDGAVDLFPHQHAGVRAVRAHADRRRGGRAVSYLEGCTAPKFDTNQLHAAVVELVALDDADIKYSTVQNWYAGDENGVGGIYNFVTKRGLCKGVNSKISWTQVETGSAITWKYPSCVLLGDNSIGEFYSVALTNHHQQADTGTKMIHIGKNTRSTIVSKGISAGSRTTATAAW
jgi:Fe-S cluster assembly protein SufB